MSRPCILVVDNHPEDLRLLEVSLKNAGFAVTTATNGRDALRKVEISPPDLIISETALPEMDGFEFVKALKEKPDWATIPFLFLSEERSVEHKVRGLEQGVDDYLVKPVFVKELVARLRLILQRKKRESLEGRSSKTRFSGSLDDIGLVDLIQTIDLSKKTGALHLTHGTDRGVIYFQDGEVVDAEIGRHRGVAAVYRLLTWSEGYFDVDFRPVRRSRTIHLSSQEILMEGMRRLDEWGRLVEQLPPLDTIFMVDAGELIGRLDEIPDEVNAIIRLTDGTRSLEEIIDSAPFDDLETLKIITRLSFYGIFIETGRKGAPPPRTEFAYAKEVAEGALPTEAAPPVVESHPTRPVPTRGAAVEMAAAVAAAMPEEPPKADAAVSPPPPLEEARPAAPPPPEPPKAAAPPEPPKAAAPPEPPKPVAPAEPPKVVAPAPPAEPAKPAPLAAPAPPAIPPRPHAPPPLIPPVGLRPQAAPTLPVISAPPPLAPAGAEPVPQETLKAPAPLTFKLPPLPSTPPGAPPASAVVAAASPPAEEPAPAPAPAEEPRSAAPEEPSAAAAAKATAADARPATGLAAKPDEKKPTTLRLGPQLSAPPAAPLSRPKEEPAPPSPAAEEPAKKKPEPTTLRLGPQLSAPPPVPAERQAAAADDAGERQRLLTPAELDAAAAQIEARSPFTGSGVSMPPAPPSFRLASGETPPPGTLRREELAGKAQAAAGGGKADEEITKVDVVLGEGQPKVIVELPPDGAARAAKPTTRSVELAPQRSAGGVVLGAIIALGVIAAGIYLFVRYRGGGTEEDADTQLAVAPEVPRPDEDAGGWAEPMDAGPIELEAAPVEPGWEEDVVLGPEPDAAAEQDVEPLVEDVVAAFEVGLAAACGDDLVKAARDLWRKRDRAGAFDQLRAAIACDPAALQPRLQWARWVSDMPNLFGDAALCAEAAQVAQPAAEANPNQGELWFHYTNLLYGAKQREAADAAKEHCLAIRPRDDYSTSCRYLPQ